MHDFLGVKQFASIMCSCIPATRAGVLEPLQKWVGHVLSMSLLTFCNPVAPPIFFNGSNTPALTGGSRRTPLRIMEAPGKSCIDFHSHRECMEEEHEYANELGKQSGKNTKNHVLVVQSKYLN